MTVIVLASIAVLLGALVRGYTGFGASMFWVVSLSLVYPRPAWCRPCPPSRS